MSCKNADCAIQIIAAHLWPMETINIVWGSLIFGMLKGHQFKDYSAVCKIIICQYKLNDLQWENETGLYPMWLWK